MLIYITCEAKNINNTFKKIKNIISKNIIGTNNYIFVLLKAFGRKKSNNYCIVWNNYGILIYIYRSDVEEENCIYYNLNSINKMYFLWRSMTSTIIQYINNIKWRYFQQTSFLCFINKLNFQQKTLYLQYVTLVPAERADTFVNFQEHLFILSMPP